MPKHQLSQHTPSAQYPDVHCAADVHAVPLGDFVWVAEHAPDPLHSPGLHSLSGSETAAMFPQTPLYPLPFFAVEHAWHAPMQMFPQQYPSTQYFDKHCAVDVHDAPLYRLHTFFPSHAPSGQSLSGSLSYATDPHTPSTPPPFFDAVHAMHRLSHAVSQQTPSAQYPVAQSEFFVHAIAVEGGATASASSNPVALSLAASLGRVWPPPPMPPIPPADSPIPPRPSAVPELHPIVTVSIAHTHAIHNAQRRLLACS